MHSVFLFISIAHWASGTTPQKIFDGCHERIAELEHQLAEESMTMGCWFFLLPTRALVVAIAHERAHCISVPRVFRHIRSLVSARWVAKLESLRAEVGGEIDELKTADIQHNFMKNIQWLRDFSHSEDGPQENETVVEDVMRILDSLITLPFESVQETLRAYFDRTSAEHAILKSVHARIVQRVRRLDESSELLREIDRAITIIGYRRRKERSRFHSKK